MGIQVRNSNGDSVTGVYAGAKIRLYASGVLWGQVGFSIIDSARNTFLANTVVDVSILGTAWLDITAPSIEGTYKLYAYNGADIGGTHEYMYFRVMAASAGGDDESGGDSSGEDGSGKESNSLESIWEAVKPYALWIGLAIVVVWLLIFSLPDKK